MDLVQLRYFMTVVECGSFTLAAKRCQVSQPALSQQIAKLEKEFGCALFNRQGRQVILTPAGETLRNGAATILNAVADTQKQMKDDGETGRVNFGVAPVIGPYLAARILKGLRREFPNSEIGFTECSIAQLLDRVESGALDLAVVPLPVCKGRDVVVEPLYEEEIKLAISRNHALANTTDVEWGMLRDIPLVLLNPEHHFNSLALAALEEVNVRPVAATLVDTFAMMNYLVSLEMGVGFIPQSSLNRQPSGNVVYRSIKPLPLVRHLGVCWNGRRFQSQLHQQVIKFLRFFELPELIPWQGTSDERFATDSENGARLDKSAVDMVAESRGR